MKSRKKFRTDIHVAGCRTKSTKSRSYGNTINL